MNKKGFTLVELITTFALTAVIVVLLINVVNVIKNIYTKSNIKTELYIHQSNLSNVLNSKITSDDLDSYSTCSDSEFCYIFNFIDNESIKLIIKENQIKFGEYVYNILEGTKIETPPFENSYIDVTVLSSNNGFLVIKIPIKSEIYPNIDFGINLVYPYNPSETAL